MGSRWRRGPGRWCRPGSRSRSRRASRCSCARARGWRCAHGLTLLNSPGTIDSDYRGEIGVILINHGAEPVVIAHGMRVAQLVLAPVARAVWREATALAGTVRGAGGFGSTGTGPRR